MNDLRHADGPPAFVEDALDAGMDWGFSVLRCGGISAASSAPIRPLVPAPTLNQRPPPLSATGLPTDLLCGRSHLSGVEIGSRLDRGPYHIAGKATPAVARSAAWRAISSSRGR